MTEIDKQNALEWFIVIAIWAFLGLVVMILFMRLIDVTEDAFFTTDYITLTRVVAISGWATVAWILHLIRTVYRMEKKRKRLEETPEEAS